MRYLKLHKLKKIPISTKKSKASVVCLLIDIRVRTISNKYACLVACLKDFRAFQWKIQLYNVICPFELPSGVFCKYVALITNEVIPKITSKSCKVVNESGCNYLCG